MFKKTTLATLSACLLAGISTASVVSTGVQEDALSLKGCLLLSRKPGVYALHMEYNRIAAEGHADLPSHVGHIVTLIGTFEEQGDELRFIVEEIVHLAPTCEIRASIPTGSRYLAFGVSI